MSNTRNEEKRFSSFFRALSNENRLSIFKQLTQCCRPGSSCSIEEVGLCVGDIGASLEIAPSTLSHHLKELHQAGLIEMHRRGKQVMCRVNPAVLQELSDYFSL